MRVCTNLLVKIGKLQGAWSSLLGHVVELSKIHAQTKFEHATREMLLSVESLDCARKRWTHPHHAYLLQIDKGIVIFGSMRKSHGSSLGIGRRGMTIVA